MSEYQQKVLSRARSRLSKELTDLFIPVVLLGLASMWLWGPVLSRMKPRDGQITNAVIMLSMVITIEVCLLGTLVIVEVVPV